MRTTTGRCRACKVRYTWPGQPLLRNAYCPVCGMPLFLTTHLWKGKESTRTPSVICQANRLRRHVGVY
jgi:rRNA maturation endonuclease Nob1